MVKSSNLLVVEADTETNSNWRLAPLSRTLRGRFDPLRLPEPGGLRREFPKGLPGERLELDVANGKAAILEPIHEAEHAEAKAAVERRGMTPGPARQELGTVDVDTLAFWIDRAVQAGIAKIVSGEVPNYDPSKAQRNFLSPPQPDTLDRLTAAMERQADMLAKVLERLT